MVNGNCKIFHDSEWSGSTWVSTCLLFTIQNIKNFYESTSDHKEIIIYFNNNLTFDRAKFFYHKKIITKYVFLDSFVEINKHFITHLEREYWNYEIEIINFFSPTDIFYIFPQYFECALYKDERERLGIKTFNPYKNNPDTIFFNPDKRLQGYVNINNKKIIFEDYSKIFGHGSLLSKLNLFGLEDKAKTLMDDYKSNIHIGLQKHPSEFFEYAIDDVLVLPLIKERGQEVFSQICKEVGVPIAKMSLTIGGTVNKLLVNSIKINFNPIVWTILQNDGLKSKYVINSNVSLIDTIIHYAPKNIKQKLLRYRQPVSLEMWEAFDTDKDVRMYLSYITNKKLSLLGLLSHRGIMTNMKSDSKILNLALVSGGRCNNEHSDEQVINNVIDIDISSCYSNIMSKLEIPIGKFHTDLESNIKTIGDFVNDFVKTHKIYKHYWVISFNTKLSFDQDLFVSKIYDENKLYKYAELLSTDEERELENFHSTILRREIVNGILTEPLLDIILVSWGQSEIEELFNSQITRAIFYLKKDKLDINEFVDTIDFNKYRASNQHLFSFTTFSLSNLVVSIRDKRNFYKQTSKTMAEALKTIGNTIYGVLCSPYFEVGNVLVANLITSIARSQVYMMAKAFNLVQTITDGGLFSIEKLNKRPSVFSSNILTNHLKTFSLQLKIEEIVLPTVAKAVTSDLLNHLWHFWSSLKNNKLLNFNIELKLDNTSYRAAYSQKADYVLLTVKKEIKIKVRGNKPGGYSEKVNYYKSLVLNEKYNLTNRISYTQSLYKLGAYIFEQNSSEQSFRFYKHLLPGSLKKMWRIFYIRNTHYLVNTKQEFLGRQKDIAKVLRHKDQLFETSLIPVNESNPHTLNKFTISAKLQFITKKFGTIVFQGHLYNALDDVLILPESLKHKQFYNKITQCQITLVNIFFTFESYKPFAFEKLWIEKILDYYYNQIDYIINKFIFILPKQYHSQLKISLNIFWCYHSILVPYEIQ
jgi:hypothetical protein